MTDAPDRPPVSRGRTALAVLLVAVLYLWVFPYHAPVNNPNENVRIYMTVAVVEDHTFAINRVEGTWGYVNDKSVRDGKLYSSKAPGTSYLGVPFYWALTKLTGRTALPLLDPRTHAVPPGVPPRPLLDRTKVVWFLRVTGNVFPALLFAWFWHRFLDRRTRSPALRDAVFFSTMAGSSVFAYSVVFASHAQNALCLGAAIMALATVRDRDRDDVAAAQAPAVRPGLMFLGGLFGAGCTMFEYPAGIATGAIALWIAALGAERRRALLLVAALCAGVAGALAVKHHRPAALVAAGLAGAAYLATLSGRSTRRMLAAGLGGAIPTALTLLYHKRCFGNAFKPGYSFLENPTFREETNQGFFGATAFSWEAGLRVWLDPAFGLIPSTPVFLLALAGFGSYLGWAPTAGEVETGERALRRRIASTFFAGAAIFAVARALTALRASPLSSAHAAVGPWLAALVVALVALGSAQLPRPKRADVGLGAVLVLACYGLTRLIGAMNNWRGGWQVGPRYLVTLVPVLALGALAGLEALHGRGGLRARFATVFAGGATLAAMLVTGAPSAWFPHIPTEFGAPFFEMILPLVQGGLVPHNAGHLVKLTGALSMVGFGLAAGLIALRVARGDERRPVAVLAHGAASLAVTLVLLVPQALAFRPESAGPARYVLGAFEPRPPGLAAAVPLTAPPGESATQAAQRARALAERGDAPGALEAWLRAIRAGR